MASRRTKNPLALATGSVNREISSTNQKQDERSVDSVLYLLITGPEERVHNLTDSDLRLVLFGVQAARTFGLVTDGDVEKAVMYFEDLKVGDFFCIIKKRFWFNIVKTSKESYIKINDLQALSSQGKVYSMRMRDEVVGVLSQELNNVGLSVIQLHRKGLMDLRVTMFGVDNADTPVEVLLRDLLDKKCSVQDL